MFRPVYFSLADFTLSKVRCGLLGFGCTLVCMCVCVYLFVYVHVCMYVCFMYLYMWLVHTLDLPRDVVGSQWQGVAQQLVIGLSDNWSQVS